ncbi:MAG: hypothetical protein FJ144_06310 [Deltaproteobacteria bacterium]|nr:hypothetical protein [Deltaproteobacteria bacterium]
MALTIRSKAILAATLVASALVATASAHPPSEHPSCLRDCRADGRECLASLRDEVRLCRESECGEKADVVRAACGDDRDSEACAHARGELRVCLDVCRAPLGGPLQACRAERRDCAGDCPRSPAVDGLERTCVVTCAKGLRACRRNLDDSFDDCRGTCRELHQTARETCTAGRPSPACRSARHEARACTRECRSEIAEALAPCRDTFRGCLEGCPEA